MHEGVLIEPGSEKQGFDCWPLQPAIIDWKADKDSVARHIVSTGGIIFYAHTEEPHNWANPITRGWKYIIFIQIPKISRQFPYS